MKQNRGVGKKILPWILAVVFGAVVLVGVSVYVNPDAILPVDWAEKVHKFKKNVGLEEKYNGYDYRTLEGGGEQILISEDEVVYVAPDEDVAVNDTGREYNNNVMSIMTYELLDDSTVEELLSSYGAKVVGYSRDYNGYTVKFPRSYSLDEIYQLREDLGKIPEFEAVNIGYLSGDSTKLIPNDAMWNEKDPNSEWSDSVGSSGRNWGVEAINAPQMWDNLDKMSYVNVGILDNHFYEDHEDIIFSEILNNDSVKLDSKEYGISAHGTHVAGTMSAIFNNNLGIAGVAPKTTLYGASFEGVRSTTRSNIETYVKSFNWLIGEKDCKVINVSFGGSDSPAATSGSVSSQENIRGDANTIAAALQKLIDEGKEFVIVKAAGNENASNQPANAVWEALSYIGTDGKYQDVADRVIVVGRVYKNSAGFAVYETSNFGERVDIVAPGQNIYSTSYKKIDPLGLFGYRSSYSEMSGTSMSAPHVSGVAASLFSLKPQLTGSQVKQIICDSATVSCKYDNGKFNTKDYKLLDAGAAANMAIDGTYLDMPSVLPGTGFDSDKYRDIILMNDSNDVKKVWVSNDIHLGDYFSQCGISFTDNENETVRVSFGGAQNSYHVLDSDDSIEVQGNKFTLNVSVPSNLTSIRNPYSGKLEFLIGKDGDRYFIETNPILSNGEKSNETVRFYRNVDRTIYSMEDIRNAISNKTNEECPENIEIAKPYDMESSFSSQGYTIVYIPGGIGDEKYETWVITKYGYVCKYVKTKSRYDSNPVVGPSVF